MDAIIDIGRAMIDQERIPESLKIAWISGVWKGNNRMEPFRLQTNFTDKPGH